MEKIDAIHTFTGKTTKNHSIGNLLGGCVSFLSLSLSLFYWKSDRGIPNWLEYITIHGARYFSRKQKHSSGNQPVPGFHSCLRSFNVTIFFFFSILFYYSDQSYHERTSKFTQL